MTQKLTYLEYLDTPEGAALARLRWRVEGSAGWRYAENASAPPVPFYGYSEEHGWPGLKQQLQALHHTPTPTGETHTCAECGRQFADGEAFDVTTQRFCYWG